jgi:hypothetical protein
MRGEGEKEEQELVLLSSTTYGPRQHARKESVIPAPYSVHLKELSPLTQEDK